MLLDNVVFATEVGCCNLFILVSTEVGWEIALSSTEVGCVLIRLSVSHTQVGLLVSTLEEGVLGVVAMLNAKCKNCCKVVTDAWKGI